MKQDIFYIPIILGTAREGRNSEKVAKFVMSEIEKNPQIKTEIIDVRDYILSATNNTKEPIQAKRFADKISVADGFIIVSPEYNHGYPGELKMTLDMLYEEYARKPLAICGVSIGGLGGARMVEQLRLVSIEFHMVPIREAVYFSGVSQLFDNDGNIKDPLYESRIKSMADELLWYAKALKLTRLKKD